MDKVIIKDRICWKKCKKFNILTIEMPINIERIKVSKVIISGSTFKKLSRKPKYNININKIIKNCIEK